jgi:ABC-type Fe3+/spermidine/putrescine transport system ATPase subunit
VDLVVRPGEYVCVLGPSGSGKSTLLRLVAGFERPDAGTIHLQGERVEHLPPERRPVHTVFQGYALFPHLTVFENVAFGLRMRKVPRSELRDRVEESLERVGLPGFGPRRPGLLSGGEQQRVALARALVNRPPLLLLDEPLAALDRRLRLRLQEELRGIQQEVGVAFLHVTHDQEEALRLGDRVVVMDGGRILQGGTPSDVYLRPVNTFVADFLGASNILAGRLEMAPGPRLVLRGGGVLPLSGDGSGVAGAMGGQGGGAAPPLHGREGEWAVRPEAIVLVPGSGEGEASGAPGPSGFPGPPHLPGEGRVEGRVVLGGVQEVRVRLGTELLRVHVLSAGAEGPAPGDGVGLRVRLQDLVPLEP